MKPNYKAITKQQWEEIFKAVLNLTTYGEFEVLVDEDIATIRFDGFKVSFSFVFERFHCIKEIPLFHLKGIRKMSEYIDLGIGNNMPKELTAENGAKALLVGEFHETIEVDLNGECYCDNPECKCPDTDILRIPVDWRTIKSIYTTLYSHFNN